MCKPSKIYIVGPVGSGKSTLAKKLSKIYGLPYFELDSVVHMPDPNRPNGNRKRPESEIQSLFSAILKQDKWIMEDTGRPCFEEGMRQADSILLLVPNAAIRAIRIVLRWVKQNLHKVNYGSKPSP